MTATVPIVVAIAAWLALAPMVAAAVARTVRLRESRAVGGPGKGGRARPVA